MKWGIGVCSVIFIATIGNAHPVIKDIGIKYFTSHSSNIYLRVITEDENGVYSVKYRVELVGKGNLLFVDEGEEIFSSTRTINVFEKSIVFSSSGTKIPIYPDSELTVQVAGVNIKGEVGNWKFKRYPVKSLPPSITKKPILSIVEGDNGKAVINYQFRAEDDVDITNYILKIKGFTAGELKRVNGLIDRVKELVFVEKEGFSQQEGQVEFTLVQSRQI
jgi:hypothetical protein